MAGQMQEQKQMGDGRVCVCVCWRGTVGGGAGLDRLMFREGEEGKGLVYKTVTVKAGCRVKVI